VTNDKILEQAMAHPYSQEEHALVAEVRRLRSELDRAKKVVEAAREYKREMTNPAKDLALCAQRRKELFAAYDAPTENK
jgi:hypothetical protein